MPLLADEDLAVSKGYGVTGWLGPLARFTELKETPGGRYVQRAIFVIDGEGIIRHRHVSRTGASFQSVDDIERALAAPGLIAGAAAAPFSRQRTERTVRGEVVGEGTPIVLCHGI